MNRFNILISTAGKRVSLVRAFQNEVRNLNLDILIYASDINTFISSACNVADKCFDVYPVSHKKYLSDLRKKCIDNNIKLLIPTIDTELQLLSDNRAYFENKGIKLLLSDSSFIEKCRDKRLIHKFFKSKNIPVAQEYQLDSLIYPVFAKPFDGSRSVDTFYIKTPEDLTDRIISNLKLMYLEYIDHNIYTEYTVDAYYDKYGDLKCAVPRERIEVRDGEVNKGKTDKNEICSIVEKNLSHLDGVIGCITIQFFFDKSSGSMFGIEINPRFGGGYPLSYLAGANFPKYILQEYILNRKVEFFSEWKDCLYMLRYDAEILVDGNKEK